MQTSLKFFEKKTTLISIRPLFSQKVPIEMPDWVQNVPQQVDSIHFLKLKRRDIWQQVKM